METLIATYAFAATVIVGYAGCLMVASRRASRRLRALQAQRDSGSKVTRSRKVA